MVIAIIGLATALVLPQFMPAIAYGSLEGSARHLANFGRAAVNRAAFAHERYTFHCDVATGQYWLVRWKEVVPERKKDKDEGLFKKESLFSRSSGTGSSRSGYGGSGGERTTFFNQELASTLFSQSPSLEALVTQDAPEGFDEQALEMQERFDRFSRLSLMTRARNVNQEGIFDEMGPLFEKKFTLSVHDEDEDQSEEETDPLLSRTYLPEGVVIESVRVGNSDRSKGTAEVEITPLGFTEPVTFVLRNTDGDRYTVVWDAITGGAHLYSGKRGAA